MKNKRVGKRIIAVLMTAVLSSSILGAVGTTALDVKAAEVNLAATKTTKSPEDTYQATTLVNGDFEVEPWMNYTYNGTTYTKKSSLSSNTVVTPVPNGVGGGWNTTENTIFSGTLFEYLNAGTVRYMNSYLNHNSGYAVEMNANKAATLYQDLATNSGDIIKWTLDHAVRYNFGDNVQSMQVEIGGINGPASGTQESINTNLIESTKAVYNSRGVTNGGATYGYANNAELVALDVSKTDTVGRTKWNKAAGVYVIPEGQTTTRFAFVSTCTTTPDGGNLLDNITFQTLLGHLEAKSYTNGAVRITGYWGETDPTKKLVVDLEGRDYAVDMSAVVGGSYFQIEVPASVIGTASEAVVWHESYTQARKNVEILKYVNYNMDGLNNVGVKNADGSAVQPTKRVSGNYADDTTNNSATLVVNLNDASDTLTVYKIADVAYKTKMVDNVPVGYYETTWVDEVKTWMTSGAGKTDYSGTIYKDPLSLGKNSSETQRSKFYKALLSNADNILTGEGALTPFVKGKTPLTNVGHDADSDTTVTFEQMPFGIYAIMTPSSAPVVASIVPYANGPAGQYYVNYVYSASLKDAAASIEKTIKGAANSTVAIGEEVDFAITASLPLAKTRITKKTDGTEDVDHAYKLYIEDTMAGAFLLQSDNTTVDADDFKITYKETEGGAESKLPSTPVTYYEFGPSDCTLDSPTPTATIDASNYATYIFDKGEQDSNLIGAKAYAVSAPMYEIVSDSTIVYGQPVQFKVVFNVPAIKAWLAQEETPSSIEDVIVNYKATVTDKITVGSDGNTNEAVLHSEGNDPVPAIARAYTYAMNLIKIDGETASEENPTRLPGAEFELYKEVGTFTKSTDEDATEEQKEYSWDGEGANPYTVTKKNADEGDEVVPATPDDLKSKKGFYVYEETAEKEVIAHIYELCAVKIAKGDSTLYSFNGSFTTYNKDNVPGGNLNLVGTYKVSGLAPGEYVLVETHAPTGYNDLAEDILFSIKELSADEAMTESLKACRDMDDNLIASGTLEIDVLNFKGFTLPSTGGDGIGWYLLVGMSVMMAVMIILVLRRKSN